MVFTLLPSGPSGFGSAQGRQSIRTGLSAARIDNANRRLTGNAEVGCEHC